MNKNSNVYIIIYASVMIIIVAVLLSVASMALKSRQQANTSKARLKVWEGEDAHATETLAPRA